MQPIRFDFNNLFSSAVGTRHGIKVEELEKMAGAIRKAHLHLRSIVSNSHNRVGLGLEWANLPFQEKSALREIKQLGDEIAKGYDQVLFLGIGGSYLGLKAAQEALCPPYFNEFTSQRRMRPKIYFAGNNLDPEALKALLKNLAPKKTFVVVISKSGETTETKTAFLVVENWLKDKVGQHYGRQVLAITDPKDGSLRREVFSEQAKDELSFRSLPLLKGVGGRFSELNMGLLHLAVVGIDIETVLSGAREMAKRCARPGIFDNPAYLYATLSYLLYQRKNKVISIMMPFSEALKATADWYVQLLAESLGKRYARKIRRSADGKEAWEIDKEAIVEVGRTPIAACGTSDLHSIQQNNIEGENNKMITFLRVEKFRADLRISAKGDILSGKSYSRLMNLAQEATEWALVHNGRPNCTIILPEVSAYYWGALLFFLEMAVAFEGELLNVNAFDQPGVEGYKNYLYYKLRKSGVPPQVVSQIKKHPLSKNPRFILT